VGKLKKKEDYPLNFGRRTFIPKLGYWPNYSDFATKGLKGLGGYWGQNFPLFFLTFFQRLGFLTQPQTRAGIFTLPFQKEAPIFSPQNGVINVILHPGQVDWLANLSASF